MAKPNHVEHNRRLAAAKRREILDAVRSLAEGMPDSGEAIASVMELIESFGYYRLAEGTNSR